MRVYSGATGLLVAVTNGTTANGNFGTVIAAVGDYDGNGFPDFAADFNGGARVISSSNGAVIATIAGMTATCPWGAWRARGISTVTGFTNFGLPPTRRHRIPSGSVRTPTSASLRARRPSEPRAPDRPACRSSCAPARSPSERGPLFGLELLNAPANVAAVLFAGQSTASWMVVPLPWMPAPVSMPGCAVYVAPEFCSDGHDERARSSIFSATGSGRMGLSGYFASFQCYVLNPGAVVMPGALTGALQVLCL